MINIKPVSSSQQQILNSLTKNNDTSQETGNTNFTIYAGLLKKDRSKVNADVFAILSTKLGPHTCQDFFELYKKTGEWINR